MPTYSYRCKICGFYQVLRQDVQESIAPACPLCGGFSERTLHQAPPVLGASPPPKPQSSSKPDDHTCGSSCVLHQDKKPSETN
jgi:putative FmdB family regulatory protein